MSALRGTTNLLGMMPKRYASAAAAQPKSSNKTSAPLPKESVRVSKANNGITVASLENYSPITRIAAVVNAGARDETYNEQGVAHALRVYSSLATRNYSVFGLSRNLNQIGAELSVNASREQTTYLVESTRTQVARSADILGEILSRPEFRHWEIHDAEPRLKFDLDVYDESPELRLTDLIHRAAFRNSLSRSLYAPRFNLGSLNSETLQNFRAKHFTSDRLTLVGVGIQHDDLLRYAEFFRLGAPGNYKREQARYNGSELREETSDDLVQLAIASEGVSASSKDALVSGIVSHAFGAAGPRIKYSSGANKLAKSVLPLASQPALVSSFNVNYSDSGLFGFNVIANKSDVGKIAKGVFAEVAKSSKNGLTAQEITNSKNSLKATLAYENENAVTLINSIGSNPQSQQSVNELFAKIDAVSANDINAFVKRLATSKPSLAAIGNLSELPRIDELSSS